MPEAKPHPGRKRRLLGWAILASGLLFELVWLASGIWWFHCKTPNCTLDIDHGLLSWTTYIDADVTGGEGWSIHQRLSRGPRYTWRLDDATPYSSGWSRVYIARTTATGLDIWRVCLWPFPLILLLVGGVPLLAGKILRIRRVRVGHCPQCNYDIRGLPEGSVCPECGK